jgi:hypothetical protein
LVLLAKEFNAENINKVIRNYKVRIPYEYQYGHEKENVMALKKSELYSSLWSSCDALRGGMDASQYKDYYIYA